ncbi:hypothetical protein [Streptomyces sp. NPDC093568]|uniref:SCO2400 family protein n=1 Tax=Streptomyces sp. NPDC093568 TaxID=3366041 RepID=UPI0037F7E605
MDYCSSCRRHLNGALVCPGCGAYAPDIAPSAVGGAPGSAAPGAATWGSAADAAWYDDHPQDGATPSDHHDETAPGEAEGVPAAPQGRAARRRQRARWKKNQRRAVVATAVALVGGGLTVASMDRGSGDKAQAATAPEHPNAGLPEQQETELTRPASTPPDTREAGRTDTPTSKPSPTNAARESISTPRTTRQFTRPDVAGTPSPTATTVPQTQTVSPAPASGSGGGAAEAQQPAPTPTPTDGANSGASPAPSSPEPQETTPAQLCVLNVVCLG